MQRDPLPPNVDFMGEMEAVDESVLLDRLGKGDIDAFEILFRAYFPLLCDVVVQYLHSRDEAEDVVQELFWIIWRDRESLHIRGRLRNYLCMAARNRALNAIGRSRIIRLHQESQQTAPASTADANEQTQLEIAERHAQIMQALAELPPRRRVVCMLRWIDGLSYAEIAQRLGISEKTIANQLTQALSTLRGHFGIVSQGRRPP